MNRRPQGLEASKAIVGFLQYKGAEDWHRSQSLVTNAMTSMIRERLFILCSEVTALAQSASVGYVG
jgi:hypothetical protein